MNFFEQVVENDGEFINSEQTAFEITQATQMQLMKDADTDVGSWITANSERFRTLMQDPELNLVERLAKRETRAEAMEEIKSKLYN